MAYSDPGAFGAIVDAISWEWIFFINPIIIAPLLLLALAYAVRRLPYVTRAAIAGLQQCDPVLEQAARSMGASGWSTLRRISLPLLGAHLAAGGVLANAFRGSSTRFCLMSFTSDWLFPTRESREIVHALNAAAANVSFVEVASDKGHDAFFVEEPEFWAGLRGFIDALDGGFREAEQMGLPRVGLCVSLLRTQTADEATELVGLLTGWRHPRVVALSVDGNEATAGRTGPRFADAFRRAGEAGLKRTVHAGESSGAEGVRDAIELLQADRIDHGVRAIDDPAVVDLLVDKGIPLGVCPSSNLVLKVYPSLDAHPVERLRAAGVRLSLNTDDPSLLGTTLPREYALCRKHFGWSDETLRELARTSIDASFANADVKTRLCEALNRW